MLMCEILLVRDIFILPTLTNTTLIFSTKMFVTYRDHCSFTEMEGLHHGGRGVTLVNGTMDSSDQKTLILTNGTRIWRFRVPSVRESLYNVLILEVKQGATWYPAQQFVVTD